MKAKEVPQDLKYFKDKVVRDLAYAVDEEGRYTSIVSDGWAVKNDLLGIVWEDILEECEPVRQQVLAKELSPIAWHMKKNLQDLGMLSAYSGIPKRKIKKHLQYEEFMKLDAATLQKYADALRISVEELKQVN
jgi:transposase-like protein